MPDPANQLFSHSALPDLKPGLLDWVRGLSLGSLGITFLLLINTVSLVLGLSLPYVAVGTMVLLMALLFVPDQTRPSRRGDTNLYPAPMLIAVLAVTVATIANPSIVTVPKLVLMAAFFLIVPLAMSRLKLGTLIGGIILFAGVETIFVWILASEFNPNAAAQRITVALCVLGLTIRYRWFRYAMFFLALTIGYYFEARTAICSAFIAFIFVSLSRTRMLSALRKYPVIAICLLGGTAFFWQTLAMEYLVNQSPQAVQAFFADKKQKDMKTDPFDRKAQWESAWRQIPKRPLVGFGLGNEMLATQLQRAHSAYLKLTLECGIPAAMAVVFFYLYMLRRSCTILTSPFAGPIPEVACFCLLYMLISGFFESSGLFSIGTPTNLLAYIGFAWLHTRRE